MKVSKTWFSQECFNRSDERGKMHCQWMLFYMYGVDAFINEGYGVDLTLYDKNGKKVGYAEAEEKIWLNNFNFDSLHVPARKRKFLQFSDRLPVLFCYVNPEGTKYYITRGSYMLDMDPVEVCNRRNKTGEKFYKVPMEKVIVIGI